MLVTHLEGRLGSDPEYRGVESGTPMIRFNVANNYRARSRAGEWEDRVEWVRVTFFGKRAESLSRLLGKGSRVLTYGRLEARPWIDNGNQPRAGLELLAADVEVIDGRQHHQAGGEVGSTGRPRREREPTFDVPDIVP
jgi:single-strand DNA-binding protein